MTTLEWNRLPGSTSELAAGDDWTYLITQDDRAVVLTRWETGPNPAAYEVARQAALYAIRIGGAFGLSPEADAAVIAHLRSAAQQYESGIDVDGQPAWRHGYRVPEPRAADPCAALSEVHWAPYTEFGIPDPALETIQPPAVPVLVRATSYRREQGTEQVVIYWLEGPS